MPRSNTDPFFIAEQARFGALERVQAASHDIEYLRAVFMKEGIVLNDCDILSVTYLAWYESLASSGVHFSEHAGRYGRPACKLSQELGKRFISERSQREEDERNAHLEWVDEERQREKLLLAGGGSFGIAAIALAWFLFRRRSRLAGDKSENEDKRAAGDA